MTQMRTKHILLNRRRVLAILGSVFGTALVPFVYRRINTMNQNLKNPLPQMPVLFLGHGSPMNAIETNSFTQALRHLGEALPTPRAILAISAHWMTRGTWVTHMQKPKTIHDFGGFPQELFDVQYPAPGSPELADLIRTSIQNPTISADDSEWGLDHGTWSVLKHLYPNANIPVVQLSLDMSQPSQFHFELGQKLQTMRQQGILIVGSGNIVHNLRQIRWEPDARTFDWALEFDAWAKQQMEKRNFSALTNDYLKTEAGRMSVPTPDHYYPLLYILGATQANDTLHFDFEGTQHGSISMRCVRFG